jgi:hypothetical protein
MNCAHVLEKSSIRGSWGCHTRNAVGGSMARLFPDGRLGLVLDMRKSGFFVRLDSRDFVLGGPGSLLVGGEGVGCHLGGR